MLPQIFLPKTDFILPEFRKKGWGRFNFESAPIN